MDLAQITGTIQLISSFVIAITGALVALGALVKPVGRWLKGLIQKAQADEKLESAVEQLVTRQDLIKKATEAITRNSILQIYHDAEEKGYIRDWDRDNFLKMYAAYTALGGNSFVHSIYDIIKEMPSIPAGQKPPRKTKRRTKDVKKA